MSIVTGTIRHRNATVWDLTFDDRTEETLGVTANHPLYSETRHAWIPAGDLQLDEVVRTLNGQSTLTARSQRPTRETVFNLEVHRSHAYHVSGLGVLAHNTGLPCPVSRVWPKHHPFPKYLGGAADQTLKKIPRNLHYQFHASLDKWMGGKYARAHTASAFKNVDRAEVIKDLTKFYKTADGGAYAKYLDDFLQAVKESGY